MDRSSARALLVTTLLTASLLTACGSGSDPQSVSTAPVPTVSPSGRAVCGIVPAKVVTLVVGTSDWTTQDLPPLTPGPSVFQACSVRAKGESSRRLLEVEKETRADAATVIRPEIRQHLEAGDRSIPSDVPGYGYVQGSTSGRAQARLLVGKLQIQVNLSASVPGRDEVADVVALTRLLVPAMVEGQSS